MREAPTASGHRATQRAQGLDEDDRERLRVIADVLGKDAAIPHSRFRPDDAALLRRIVSQALAERAEAERDAARRRLAACERGAIVPYNAGLLARIEQLQHWLSRYGKHDRNCVLHKDGTCECGWSDVIKAPPQSRSPQRGRSLADLD